MKEKLINKFFEEATELVADLEESLLALEQTPIDNQLINRIFRALHTLKGSGGMFGYYEISELTHDLETLYDEVRHNTLTITPDMLSLTLKAVDLIRVLLEQTPDSEAPAHPEVIRLRDAIRKYIPEREDGDAEPYSARPKPAGQETGDTLQGYEITFKPGVDILRTGNNPLYLMDELFSMGTCRVKSDASLIPDLEHLDVYTCYTSFQAILESFASEEVLREVFMFVEEQSDITILIKELPPREHTLADVPKEEGVIPHDMLGSGVKNTPTLRVASAKVDQLVNLVSELVTMQARLDRIAESTRMPEVVTVTETLHKLSRQLREIAFDMSMIPIHTLVTRFHRMVRDLSTELGKDIRFVTEGTDTELDKSIIESITDPILHLLRNSIDHGIEDVETRLAQGKPAQGTIILKAYHSSLYVCVEVTDDGRGIDTGRIFRKAADRGFLKEDDPLGEKEILDLMFLPGFSTASKVTSISGRGVGLDVVRQKIQEIRGDIQLTTLAGKGTTFTLKLPLTLSIIDGLLVMVGGDPYILPLDLAEQIVVVHQDFLKEAYNNYFPLGDITIPFYSLREEFQITGDSPEESEMVVIHYQGSRVGLVVDKVLGEQQVVIKGLSRLLGRSWFFSGASVLGDGNVALVIDAILLISKLSQIKTMQNDGN